MESQIKIQATFRWRGPWSAKRGRDPKVNESAKARRKILYETALSEDELEKMAFDDMMDCRTGRKTRRPRLLACFPP